MKKSIEEQVAALSENEKKTVLKVAKYGTLAILGLGIPMIIFFAINLIGIMTDYSAYGESGLIGFFIGLGLCLTIIVGIMVFIKIRFPYYSDAVADYIKKNEKN